MEEEIFTKVYRTYHKYVYRYLYSLTFSCQRAEDLTQDVFVRAFCVLDFPDEGIKAWLLTVAHNLYVDFVRKHSRLVYSGDEELSRYPAQEAQNVQNIVAGKEEVSRVMERLKGLPEAQRQAVILCLVNELEYGEAAQVMGVSVSAVTNLIYRARKTLRAIRRMEE